MRFGRKTEMAVVILALAVPAAAMADAPARYSFRTGIDLSYVDASGHSAWTEGSVGKLRYDDSNDGIVFSRAFADYELSLADTFKVHGTVEACDDDLGSALDFTQAYVEWRPVPRSGNRYRLKLGAFYAPASLENISPGWNSPFTISSSAINTWVAEELRTVGAELSVSRRPEMLGGEHIVLLHAAAFTGNDPTGSLLAWKGWSVHDRQSRFGDELPLPPLPQIQPGMMFEAQGPYVEPFREIDDRVGYYVGTEWRMGGRFRITAMHYDNRADPTILDDGQYAWTTKFGHLGAHALLPGDIEMLFQWMTGSTVMGPVMNGAHVVDTEFRSKYLLATKSFDRHRVTIRYDVFEVAEIDAIPQDANAEDGHAWTVSYQFEFSDSLSVAAESLRIKTSRTSWTYYGLSPVLTEKQLQATVRLRFGD